MPLDQTEPADQAPPTRQDNQWREPLHDFGSSVSLEAGPVRFQASAHCSALGFAAIGALVSAILLSVPPIVRAARGRP